MTEHTLPARAGISHPHDKHGHPVKKGQLVEFIYAGEHHKGLVENVTTDDHGHHYAHVTITTQIPCTATSVRQDVNPKAAEKEGSKVEHHTVARRSVAEERNPMDTTLLFGIAVIPAIVGLVQVVKDLGVPSNYAPLCAVGFGLLAGFAQFYAGQLPWISAAVTGVALGLSAVGLYAGAKTVASNVQIQSKTDGISVVPPQSAPDAPHS